MQRTLAATTALQRPGLAFEIYLEHYKGSFGDKWMWTPLVLTPPLTAAAIGASSRSGWRATWLPALSALYALDGLIGMPRTSGACTASPAASANRLQPRDGAAAARARFARLVGGLGVLAAIVRRER